MNRQANEAAALAEELHKELYAEKTPVEPAGDEDTKTAEELALEANELDVVVVPDDTLIVEPPKDADYWESKFKVLQGKYNAEVPRLSKEIRELHGSVDAMQTQLDNASKTPAPAVADLEVTDLDPEAFGEYGAEFEALAKMVKHQAANLEALSKENTYLKDTIEGVSTTQHQNTQNDFLGSLERAVPDWQTINQNPDFVQWLQEVEPISGATRQNHLDDAAETLNATKTISIFKQFSDSVVPVKVDNTAQNIARQAQPDSVNSSAPVAEQKRSYTRLEIKQFYKDVSNGVIWRGRDEEVQQIEADIFAAAGEGRITG